MQNKLPSDNRIKPNVSPPRRFPVSPKEDEVLNYDLLKRGNRGSNMSGRLPTPESTKTTLYKVPADDNVYKSKPPTGIYSTREASALRNQQRSAYASLNERESIDFPPIERHYGIPTSLYESRSPSPFTYEKKYRDSFTRKSKDQVFARAEENKPNLGFSNDKVNMLGDVSFQNKNPNYDNNYSVEKREYHNPSLFEEMSDEKNADKTPLKKYSTSEVSSAEDLQIKSYLKEMYFYTIYLILITIIALHMIAPNMYYFTDLTIVTFFDTTHVLNNYSTVDDNTSYPQRKTLRESRSIQDFWEYAENTMIDLFYWDFLNAKMDADTHSEKDDRKMFYENEILGVPRMRQVRVKKDSCKIHQNVRKFFNHCYDYYSIFSEDTDPIKTGMENHITATAWKFTEAKKLNSTFYWGKISLYGGGGYYVDLGTTKEESKNIVKELKENEWISRATRAIFVDFNLYNANVNLFCICKIVLEFPPTGGMIPHADFEALKFIRYLSKTDFIVLGLEFMMILFAIYFTGMLIKFFRREKMSFFTYFWNYVDLFIIILLYVYLVYSVYLYLRVRRVISKLADRYYKYTEFAKIKDLQINYNNIIAFLVFISWIKIIKFFDFNIVMVEFKRTLKRSFIDILGFFPIFLTIILSFTLLAFLLFGNEAESYSSVWSSFLALLQAFLGEFQYKEIQESNRILGPIFYITFLIFIFFILFNVFIAIINDAYANVKSVITTDTPKTGTYLKRGCRNILSCCTCGWSRKFEKKSVKKRIVLEEVKHALRRAGFSDSEIQIFLTKYDINTNNILEEKTQRKLMKDLEIRRFDFNKQKEQFQMSVLKSRIDELNEKLEEIEASLQPVIDKVDVLLHRP